jgi:SAM-dependent methyltransferase
LGYFGVAMVRKATLERFLADNQPAERAADELALALKEIKGATDLNHQQLLRHQISTKWDIIDVLEHGSTLDSELSCPLCGHHNEVEKFGKFVASCIFGGGELTRHQCPECDVIFGPEKMLRLSGEELSRDYEWHYQVFSEGDSTVQEVRAFHALAPKRDGVYLNWGAGAWSKTVDVLRQDGWNVYGFEPHGSAASSGPYLISDKEQLSAMRFDGIFSNNVLEHLRYPARELTMMRDLLKTGGRMSHATPCFEYLYEFTRFHLFFFLGRSRSILADQAGLHIDDFVSDGEFMNIILATRAE